MTADIDTLSFFIIPRIGRRSWTSSSYVGEWEDWHTRSYSRGDRVVVREQRAEETEGCSEFPLPDSLRRIRAVEQNIGRFGGWSEGGTARRVPTQTAAVP